MTASLEQLDKLSQANNQQIQTVVYGVYNAGKSSLLNSLTGHVKQEYFATRDIPETKKSKTFTQGNVCFVDTPGLDVNEQDTQVAQSNTYQADILLLVHRLSAGPVQDQDLAAMKKLVKQLTAQQVLVVLTEGEIADENQELIAHIKQQFNGFLNEFDFFVVSNSDYKTGVLTNDNELVYLSKIEAVKSRINYLSKKIAKQLNKIREQNKNKIKQEILNAINMEKIKRLEKMQEQQTKQKEKEKAFINTVSKLQSKVSY